MMSSGKLRHLVNSLCGAESVLCSYKLLVDLNKYEMLESLIE